MLEFTMLAAAALKGTVVLSAAALIAWTLRKRSAATRHLVWTSAAAALLALPVLSVTLPVLRVPAKSPGAIAVFQVFSSSRTGASATQPAATVATPERSATHRQTVNLRDWAVAAWAAGACFGMLQMFVA